MGWPDDEDELGFTYAEADRLLHHMIDEGLETRQLEALGFAADLIREVRRRVAAQAFKWLPVPTRGSWIGPCPTGGPQGVGLR